MEKDLTKGPVLKTMFLFALPMILGNLLQQCYNIADTLIVGRVLGSNALGAVGSSFTLMTFITSVLLGLCMGSGALFSIKFGQRDEKGFQNSVHGAFFLISVVTVILNALVFLFIDEILIFLQVPSDTIALMREYLVVIFWGIAATFLYNFFSCLLRSVGNSVVPLIYLGISAVLNIGLDLLFVAIFKFGVAGAAWATVISQYVSGIGIGIYALLKYPFLRKKFSFTFNSVKEVAGFSFLTCVQQSVMNFGILMVQGLVNSFGSVVMAAFAAAVKIDAFAYMPVQDFGNAFSTFIAQNYGAKKNDRIKSGIKTALISVTVFCIIVSLCIFIFAPQLMGLFIDYSEIDIISCGVDYLRIEGAFYIGIGVLFLLYGLFRAIGKPGMSVVLTVISLGSRVALAYGLSAIPQIGVFGIWWSVPIGWILADITGILSYYFIQRKMSKKPL
ncbi:MAG: MATE family efflux transporter [Anaeromassilibacillus sp.]|nr:MATE family efflux transporter [Anaeromassilibacillus sp.]MDY3779283.1 MATE family efflux transporter [Candidatus Limousia pullorum]